LPRHAHTKAVPSSEESALARLKSRSFVELVFVSRCHDGVLYRIFGDEGIAFELNAVWFTLHLVWDRQVFISMWTYLHVFDLTTGAYRMTIGQW
jgi:hypothetical protein